MLEFSAAATTRAGNDRFTAPHRDFQPFVPPVPPPPMFRIEIFSDTLGLAEIPAAISVSFSATKMDSIVAQAVHVFTMPPRGSSPAFCQETVHYH